LAPAEVDLELDLPGADRAEKETYEWLRLIPTRFAVGETACVAIKFDPRRRGERRDSRRSPGAAGELVRSPDPAASEVAAKGRGYPAGMQHTEPRR